MDLPKRWDVLSIGHPIRVKRMAELLDVIRMSFDAGHPLDVLLLCAIPDDPRRLGGKWDTEFFEKYFSLFSKTERERIQLGAPIEAAFGERPLHPIPNQILPYIYNASRGFTLFSQQEGESKVVHEALLCGTPVVVRDDLRGGGRDHLDGRNSLQFGTLEEARDAFIELADDEGDPSFDPSYLRPKICEEYTTERLEDEIIAVFEGLNEDFRGHIDREHLSLKLPGHMITLREGLRNSKTNDLRSRYALAVYVDELLGLETTIKDRFAAREADLRAGTRTALSREGVGKVLDVVERKTSIPAYSKAREWYNR